ncbi:unnamed protein product [Protopolystoma xenopodis]|uniref:Uncharacterized protein n=1 Tax=Protopolystoma xenopodis TaxID=117903 RepID=A0A448WWJ5_9PLAT|nr:unnamed protein product [Protopolystoma xenopodis]
MMIFEVTDTHTTRTHPLPHLLSKAQPLRSPQSAENTATVIDTELFCVNAPAETETALFVCTCLILRQENSHEADAKSVSRLLHIQVCALDRLSAINRSDWFSVAMHSQVIWQ